jgi:hypothetical protein
MKLYGHADRGLDTEDIVPDELAEITLVATSSELRRIATFLSTCATNMDAMGPTYGHEHLADRDPAFKRPPHFVVAPPDADGA